MTNEPFSPFSVGRYRLHFQAVTPVVFHDWAGSALRGGFGHALKKQACTTGASQCTDCPLLTTCAYPAIFAPPTEHHALHKLSQPPAPYVIEPAKWGTHTVEPGATWHADTVLMGRALNEMPLVIDAWRQAARRGFGQSEGRSELAAVDYLPPSSAPLRVQTGNGPVQPHRLTIPAPELLDENSITLEFQTPLRLQHNGKALGATQVDAGRLLMALVRRIGLLADFHGTGNPYQNFQHLKAVAYAVDSHKHLVWRDWTRHSTRQQKSMQLGGLTGRWTLQGELSHFLPALHLGQWVHVGKETVFGLGRYSISARLVQ